MILMFILRALHFSEEVPLEPSGHQFLVDVYGGCFVLLFTTLKLMREVEPKKGQETPTKAER